MSFAALASQGQQAAKHQRIRSYKAAPIPGKKKLTETEEVTIRRKYAQGTRIIGLIREYKVPENQIRRALGL